jgi:NPCBM/NEW2 domain
MPDSATPTAVPPPVSAANPGPKTFNLTDVEYTRNEFYWVPSEATIGTKEFRNSIKGENHTTNSITFGLGGACTELRVSVGQDAFSPRQGGPITFTVLLNDSEAASASVGPYEEAKELVVNLTGITNLKLVENRTAKDGHSVWGSPVLTCSRNPAPAR